MWHRKKFYRAIDSRVFNEKFAEFREMITVLKSKVKVLECSHKYGYERCEGMMYSYVMAKCYNCGHVQTLYFSTMDDKYKKAFILLGIAEESDFPEPKKKPAKKKTKKKK